MIKFFRHIRKSLLLENKMGKYFKYAIGEIILVVIGILIALQINNWNNQQVNAKLEKELLINLKNEFTINQTALKTMISHHEFIREGCINLLTLMGPNKPSIDENDFNELIGITGWTPSYSPQRGVLNSTLNSGKIELIKNDSLVFNLSALSSSEKDYSSAIVLINKLTEDYVIPLLLENYSYINISVGQYTSKVKSSFKTNQTAILQSQKMESLISLKRLNTEVTIESAENLYKSQEIILVLIEKELERVVND